VSEQSFPRILERFVGVVSCYFVTTGKVNELLPKPGTTIYDKLDGQPIPAFANPLILPKDAARNVGIAGLQLVDALTARREKTGRLRKFLRAVALGQADQAWDLWPRLELALEGRWLAANRDAVPMPPAEGDAVLAEYLTRHPDATEDDALAAVKMPSLDALRKHPAWKAHVNRRVGEYMDSDPDATIRQIADAVGYSTSTIHGSDAYKQRLPARKERAAQIKAEKKDQKRQNRRDALWRIARARVRELPEDHWGKRGVDGIRAYLLQCKSEIDWVDREWPAYVRSLSESDLMRLPTLSPQNENDLSPEEEDARIKARVGAYRRRLDNTRD
jgi:hypothetical protein